MAKEFKARQVEKALTPRQIELMLTGLLHTDSTFRLAKHQLELSYFSDVEKHYSIIWSTAKKLYDSTNSLPTKRALKTEIEAALDSQSWSQDDLDDIELVLRGIYDRTIEPSEIAYAKELLPKFLRQRLVCHVSKKLSSGTNSESAKELLDEAARKADDIDTVTGGATDQPFDDNWVPEPLNGRLTRVKFIDNFLRVGDAGKEVYLMMGPYGSCKTTLLVQLSVLRAQQCYEEWNESGRDPKKRGKAYIFFYEGNKQEYQLRSLSFAGQIPRSRLEDYSDKKIELSTTDTIVEYERKLFSKQLAHGLPVLGERERIETVKAQLNPCWRVIDMTGNDKNHPTRGAGLEAEIRAIIAADLEIDGGYCAGVYVDYLLAATRRHMTVTGRDYNNYRHLVGGFGQTMGNLVAAPFNCPVWLAHQLSGDSNSRGAGHKHDHSAGAECKSVAENVSFSFQVSRLDAEGRGVIACTKHRRAEQLREAVIQVEGGMSVVHDADHKFVLDPTSHLIVPRSEMNRVVSVRPGSSGRHASSFLSIPK